ERIIELACEHLFLFILHNISFRLLPGSPGSAERGGTQGTCTARQNRDLILLASPSCSRSRSESHPVARWHRGVPRRERYNKQQDERGEWNDGQQGKPGRIPYPLEYFPKRQNHQYRPNQEWNKECQ